MNKYLSTGSNLLQEKEKQTTFGYFWTMGTTNLLVLLILYFLRLDPESHPEETPSAVELAAINGHVDTFSLLAARLQMDSQGNDWLILPL